MQNLMQLKEAPSRRTVLLYGDSGAGKTCLATSFPGRMHVFDFDGKVGSAIPLLEKRSPERLTEITVTSYKPMLGSKPVPARERPFAKFAEDLNKIAGEIEKYDTIVIDSLTTLADLLMQEEMAQQPGKAERSSMNGVPVPHLKDYQIAIAYTKDLFMKILSLPCNVILTAHIMRDKDESTGAVINTLQVWGKDLPNWFPKTFEEVYRVFVKQEGKETNRYVQTVGDRKYIARSQVLGIPAEVKVDNGYADLEKYYV